MALLLSSTSRESVAAAGNRLDALVDESSGADLARIGDDLFAVLGLLTTETALRRHLADPAISEASRSRRSPTSCCRARSAAPPWTWSPSWCPPAGRGRSTWSRRWRCWPGGPRSAWRRRTAAWTRSRTSCSGSAASWTASRSWARCSPTRARRRPAGRAAAQVLPAGQRRHPHPARTDRPQPRGRSLDRAAEELAEQAAARRDRYVAHVRTAVRLSAQQEDRLAGSLTGSTAGRSRSRWSSTPSCSAAWSSRSVAS